MSIVIDCSVTLAWLYDDERSPAIEDVMRSVGEAGAMVPAIWRLEVANGLQQGVRRRRIDADFRDGALRDLSEMDVITDPDTDRFAWTRTLKLADRFRLTLYDACYLELAQRRGMPIASLDQELRAAATQLELELLI